MKSEFSRSGELARRSASLAASGILALTLAGELSRSSSAAVNADAARVEMLANKDPFSAHADKKLIATYKKLKFLVNQHPHSKISRHTIQKDPTGPVFDRYTFASLVSKTDASAGYIQVVCIAEKGSNIPDGCEMLYGVSDPLAPGQPYIVGSFLVRGQKDQYSLENIILDPRGGSREDYFNKDGSNYSHKFRIDQSPWHTDHVSRETVQTPYDHFFHNLQLVLESESIGKPPA